MKSYRLTPKAESDLRAIWRYTDETWGEKQATKYLDDIERCLKKICLNEIKPKDCSILLNRNDITVLYYPVHSHYLILRENGNFYDVLSVLHNRMNIENHIVYLEKI